MKLSFEAISCTSKYSAKSDSVQITQRSKKNGSRYIEKRFDFSLINRKAASLVWECRGKLPKGRSDVTADA